MMHFAFYDDSGRIDKVLSAPSEHHADMQGGKYIRCNSGVADDTHYVSGGSVIEKSLLNISHVIQGLEVVFNKLPEGAVIEVGGSEVTADRGNTTIEFDLPGTYRVRLLGGVKYIEDEIEVVIDG